MNKSRDEGWESEPSSEEWSGTEEDEGGNESEDDVQSAIGRELPDTLDAQSSSLADAEIMGEFDRLMKDITTTNQGTRSLGKAWDFTISGNDGDDIDLQDELREATGIGKRSKRRGRPRGARRVQLSQQVKHLLGQANDAYASGDRPTAIKIFQDVIAIEPGIASAWSTLALCHEEMGDAARALQLRIMAAHLASEAETWVELGSISREMGSMEQAVYCYRNAARLDKANPDILWDYAFCLRETGQTQKAIKAYESILAILPHDVTILAQLRDLLVQSGNLARAAQVCSAAFEHYVGAPNPTGISIDPVLGPDTLNAFGMRDIAALADLLSGLGEHGRAVDVVIRGAAWLRQVTVPSEADIDGEGLDVNLRMRLAVAKLRSGDFQAGKTHASIILAHDIQEFYELHTELADVYYEIRAYADAVAIYERLACHPQTSSLHVLSQIGACHKQMKNYKAARDVYRRIIDVDPDLHEVKMKLAEIYEILNEKQLALDLVSQVIKAREQLEQRATSSESPTQVDASLFVERSHVGPSQPASDSKKQAPKQATNPVEAQQLDRRCTDAVQRGFNRLKQLNPGEICLDLEVEDTGRWDEWIGVAEELASIFMGEKKLFITDRYKEFTGLKRRSRKEPEEGLQMATPGSSKIAAAKEYRGVELAEWLHFLVKYSFVITRHRSRYQDADHLLNKLALSNAYQEWRKQSYLWFALLAIAVYVRDNKLIVEYGRKLLTRYQFNNDACRLLLASLGGGIAAEEVFIDSTFQKFIYRELLGFERAASGVPATFVGRGRNRWDFKGGEEEEDPVPVKASGSIWASNPSPVLPTKESPMYISAYAQISGGTKSYQTEIYYLFKAYDIEPNDPVICLSLGTACIGRAMQRQVDNRNHMVTQGFAFLDKYRMLRAREGAIQAEEVEYNLGRGFQQLGLQAFAEKHYRAVLESANTRRTIDARASPGVAREAAYNLSLIYVVSGSSRLADDLYRNWLSF